MTRPARDSIRVHEEVDAALQSGRAVVALESAVVTVGLPREPLRRVPAGAEGSWDPDEPTNAQAARRMCEAVRAAGAVPAMTAVVRGILRIGLSDDEIALLFLSPKEST